MKAIISSFLLIFSYTTLAQNLAPNPSFEEYDLCPGFYSCVYPPDPGLPVYVYDWTRPTDGSTDYFNTCANAITPLVSIPLNALGHQEPRTGNAYMGFYGAANDPFGIFEYREYLQSKILVPLTNGHRYFINFWVSLAGTSGLAVDRLGAAFTTDSIYDVSFESALDMISPQFISPLGYYITDTLDWTPINGSFHAAGGERWVTIGNFFNDDDMSSPEIIGPPHPVTGYHESYYYIDDVCLLDLDGVPDSYTVVDTQLCIGDTLYFSGEPGGYYRYFWFDDDTLRENIITETGAFWLKTVNFDQCLLHIDSVYVYPDIDIDLNIGSDTFICEGETILLDATDPRVISYLWSTGEVTPSIEVYEPGTYIVEVNLDCAIVSDTIVVNFLDELSVELGEDTILCAGTPVYLAPKTIEDDADYKWSHGPETCCITTDTTGIYILTASNKCGSRSDSIAVYFSNCSSSCLQMPNAFSPNNDGLNDTYRPVSDCIFEEYRLSIYNRWGERVFVAFNVQETWDGTYKGHKAEQGIYFYYLVATPIIGDQGVIMQKGDITLLR